MSTLFYVTAVERHLQVAHEADARAGGSQKAPPRHDLGSYFARGAAENHARNLDKSWALPAIDEREEPQASLHVAHGGARGGT